jgi:neutral amino acid transport system ATP-binding protein
MSDSTVEENLSADVDPSDVEDAESDDSTVEEDAKHTPSGVPLRVENLRKSFGGIDAIDGASFGVEKGSLTGLIGPNGAGKSTTFDCITGATAPTAGAVYFENEEITGLPPHEVAERGVVRTFQIARQLDEMTVLENVMLAPGGQTGESLAWAVTPGLRSRVKSEERATREDAWETLELFELDHLAGEYAGNLSGGQRKLLELARALMTDPQMLLLDEPFAGVNPSLEVEILDRIHDLREEGYTFLLVEHDIDLIMEHCEHIVVLHQGKVLAEGDAEAIQGDERVVEAYLGGEV